VLLSSPVLPLALAVAPAIRLLFVAKAFKAVKALKLVKGIKLAKLGKSVRLLRRRLALRGTASVVLGAVALALAAVTVGSMLTGESVLHGRGQTAALLAAGAAATFGVNHLRRRREEEADAGQPAARPPSARRR
jgi:putative Ca2+/H+ antiporter (TMEM165/GDT1 family)